MISLRKPLIALALAGLFGACGASIPPSPVLGCGTGTALVGVHDGFLSVLCGCAEASGTTSTVAGGLTCTVASGTAVTFQYVGTKLRHQILSTTTGGQTFTSSELSDPIQIPGVRAHGVLLTTTGTYTFQDAFYSNMSGQIIVL